MSGDVQPRKRKDKRRKKEGGSVGAIYEPEIIHRHKKSESDRKSFDLPDQGEKIHVQSEHGIGGNICVKIIFFCLFGLLVGAVGLIYLQSQGSTDVDLPTVEESRFAEYFTGWLDDTNDDHEHEALEQDVDNEHDEQDEQEEHEDDDNEKEDQSAEQDSIFKLFGLQVDEGKEDQEELEESETANNAKESEDNGITDDEDEEDENLEDKEQDEDNEDPEEDREDEDNGVEDDDASQVDENDDDDDNNEQRIINSEEDDEISEKNKYDDEEEEEEVDDEKEEDLVSKKADNYEDEKDEVEDEKPNDDDLGYDEIYESEEGEENISKSEDKGEVQEMSDEGLENSEVEEVDEDEEKATFMDVESGIKDEEENSEEEPEYGGVAVKLGVGIALVIVAHLVLVQKWKSMSNASANETALPEVKPTKEEKKNVENLISEIEPVISRRQTLVPENISLNDEWEEQEDELEEDEIDEDSYSGEDETEEEKVQKIEDKNLESFEKLSWNDDKQVSEKNEFGEDIFNEDEEQETDQEEEEEEEEKEEEEDDENEGEEEEVENDEKEEYEEDIEEIEDEYEDKGKKPYVEVVEVSTRQEVKPEEAAPTPPPRVHKGGRGPQDFDEVLTERPEEFSKMEKIREDGIEEGEAENVADAEEPKPIETKPGNEDDWAFKEEFEFADEQFENNPKAAVQAYNKILSKKPTVLRALIGRARALDHLAEKEKSNAYLKQAINAYKSLTLEHGHLLDDETFDNLSERCIDRIRFSGAFNSAIGIHRALIKRFPQTPKYRNSLSVTYLMLNKIPQARALLNETLTLWPEDGLALVHYGFILKASDNNMEEGAKKLIAGIETNEKGVIDGFFFCHLGDALNRLGRGQEAMKWYERGVKEGLFLSKYQRSLYNVNRLKGRPWWTKEETTYQDFFGKLEEYWREIRREGLELFNAKGVNFFKIETENLTDTGDWRQLDLYFRGRKQATCSKAPITCGLVSSFKPASTCTRGQIKFSVMLPNTHVWPHCGPTNCRLRSHLGLVVPKKTYIRVADETRSWEEGKFIIFDDSFEHEVWHNGTGLRLVLIVDVWHPELTSHERLTLSPI